jgi:hypothetical protein
MGDFSIYPTGLDTWVQPQPQQYTITVSHADQHRKLNEAVSGLEAMVGISGSQATGAHEFRIRAMETGGIANGSIDTTKYSLSGKAYSANFLIDFNAKPVQSTVLSGDVTFVDGNRAAPIGPAKNVTLRVSGDTVNRLITFSGMKVLGVTPTGLLANKIAIISFTSYGPNPSDTVVGFAAEA